MNEEYYLKDTEEVINLLETSTNGLSFKDANYRLKKYGINELPKQEKDNIFKLFSSEFKEPMKIILLITVVLSFIIGEIIDAITLIVIILVDAIIGSVEEWRAKKTSESLSNMIKVKSHVIRDGKEIEIDSSDIMAKVYYGDEITNEFSKLDAYYVGLIDESSDVTKWNLGLSEHILK